MFKHIIVIGSLLLAGCSSTPSGTSGPAMGGKKAPFTLAEGRGGHVPASRPAADQLRQVYRRWQGVPYRFGGESERGIDCSAFTQTLYQEAFGMVLPRSTIEQVHLGREVERDELRPGDLVFFRTGRRMRHNGVYLGNGQFAHASSSTGVTISRLDNVYWRSRYWQARRLLEQ